MKSAKPKFTDQQILDGIRKRDNAVLAAVYQQFRPRILAHVESMGGSAEEAQDVFQEGIVAVFLNMQKLDFKLFSAFYTYLHAVCHQIWLKKFREKTRHNGVTLDAPEVLRAVEEGVSDDVAYAERQQFLMEKFQALGDACRELLRLSIIEEKKPEEIVALLGFGSLIYYYKRKSNCKDKLIELTRNDSRFKEF